MSWAGLAAGAAAWGVSTQTSYALVPLGCAAHVGLAIPVTLVCIAAALTGTWLSWRAARQPVLAAWDDVRGGGPHRFAAWVGIGCGIIFALTIANQALAAVVLAGCLR
jgi:hypothetical protein